MVALAMDRASEFSRTSLVEVRETSNNAYVLSMKEGGESSADMLERALKMIPKEATIVVDVRALRGVDTLIIAKLSTLREGKRTLVASDAWRDSLFRMRLLDERESQRGIAAFSWLIDTSGGTDVDQGNLCPRIMNSLAAVDGSPFSSSETSLPRLSIDDFVSVSEEGHGNKVTFVRPMPGCMGDSLREFLVDIESATLVVDFADMQMQAPMVAYSVILAARQRRDGGQLPLELRNIPECYSTIFSEDMAAQFGFTVCDRSS
jgi:hypothetical protein